MAYKKIFLLLSFAFTCLLSVAQKKMNNYEKSWQKIDSLIKEAGLVKTALGEVNIIYNDAKKTSNDPQIIKALLYRMSLNEPFSEDGVYENIEALEKEIGIAKGPARSILLSITAGIYWNYLQWNRRKLYDRTATPGLKKDDPATWDIHDLHTKISSLFIGSLDEADVLQQTALEHYDAIIIKGNSRHLRPTLFDLLAHRALEYFENSERYITRPAYAFEITDSTAFGAAPDFVHHEFRSADSLSLHHKALRLYQQLIAFHLNDPTPDALIDVDIARISFINNFGVQVNKDELYKKALERIVSEYPSNSNTSQAIFLLANWYMSKAGNYDPLGDTTNRFLLLEARSLCEKALALKDSSEGKSNCANLMRTILQKEIRIESEKVNPPDIPFRMLISYRNFTNGYFRLIALNDITRDKLGRESWNDEFWEKVTQLPVLKSFNYTFPDTKDHQQHLVEIKLDGLPTGAYALLASPDESFRLHDNALALQYFYVSDIAYVNNGNNYYVLNRRTGAPLPSAIVRQWESQYDYQEKKPVLKKTALYTTDKNGYFRITDTSEKSQHRSIRLDISYGKDSLFMNEYEYTYVYNDYQGNRQQTAEKDQTFLFTDRSIYRPGQIVYFKGIVVAKREKNNASEIITGKETTVKLYDANNNPVDSLVLTTSSFGSYSGKFVLPSGLLNGSFIIRDGGNESEVRISVEEYKRPRFYTELPKPSGTYRLGDTIQVEGVARSYAGNNIDGAFVNYRVVRRTMVPMWARVSYLPRIWPPHPQEQMEITHGSATTDADGKFIIRFKAIPDDNILRDQSPLFHYEVSADVTDINGETRSTSTSVSVGYQALKLQLELPGAMHTDSLKEVKVSTTNMNDVFEKAQVNILLYKLNAPSRIFRARYWVQPDQFIMSREEYYRYFPYDMYADENDMTKWQKGKKVYDTSIETAPGSAAKIPGNRLAPGWYVMEAITKDKYGEAVKDTRYVRLDGSEIDSPFATTKIEANKTTAEPGEKINYAFISNLSDVYIIHELINKKGVTRQLISTTKKLRRFDLPITEADRGRMAVNMVFIKHNRVYADRSDIDIPFYNKQLKIDYTTFRDKTLPGTSEKWKVRISGNNGDKAAAEILTAMYDASLDQFLPHAWHTPGLWSISINPTQWGGNNNFVSFHSLQKIYSEPVPRSKSKEYDKLMMQTEVIQYETMHRSVLDYDMVNAQAAPAAKELSESVVVGFEENKNMDSVQEEEIQQEPVITPRKNLNETAFFFPDLHTDADGNVEFSFTTPEALTEWKWMLLAHTKDLAFGYGEKTMTTQKQLMVQPNAPRFLREGDRIDFNTKVVNMTANELSGKATLQLFDPSNGETADGIFHNISPNQFFTAGANQSTLVNFSINIPFNYNRPVSWRIIATAALPDSADKNGGDVSDGEESLLPVISNRMLVTETLALPLKGNKTKTFSFDKLLKSGKSESLQQYGISVEFTSNPAWYAVQALPYLAETTIENAEQIFNRYYANALALKIANTSPRFREVMEQWKTSDTSALLSQLQKNEELKSLLLQETPWVLEAKTESQQKKNIALLFDMLKMSGELKSALNKLKSMQAPTGGFVWFEDGPEDRYMTQYILSGMGHLKNLGAIPQTSRNILDDIIQSGIVYLDQEIKKEYEQLKKNNKKLPAGTIDYIPAQYLYMRSFFTDIGVPGDVFPAYNYFRKQSQQSWVKQNTYMRGMIALSLFRTGDVQTAKKIMAALKETAITHDELGMYWKDIRGGYYWYEAPVESQAVMIEAFSEITKDTASVNNMKIWLLKNKQTNHWRTSKSTADACYALLLQGSDWVMEQSEVSILLGDTRISSSDAGSEAGTGYFKSRIEGSSVKPSMGNIKVEIASQDPTSQTKPSWGAVYWQYFEDLDKITSASTPLKLDKKLFIEKNTDRGPVLQPLNNNNTLHVGDKIKVRIELRADRTMEYVHMKDMRASGMEPVNVLSQYKWQGGLGYYESTKDASTNFFFAVLPKGVHVFEYELFVTHTGSFSNGITTIQCLYAPEFSSHSEGIKVNVENK